MRLAIGDRVEYEFSASEPVDFNIHYHEGNVVVAPIGRDKVYDDGGVFVPLIAQHYCLTWEAGASGAMLDYRVRPRTAAP